MKIPILSLLILCLCFQGFSQIIENVDYNIEGDIISVTYDLNNFKASAKYNITVDIIGVGINFSDSEYCYTKFGVGINF